jgi:hypothetical protein
MSARKAAQSYEASHINVSPARDDILAALDNTELFAPHFKGTSWGAWRAFLAALFALPMDDATLACYQAQTGRVAPPVAAFAEAALIVGRRGGKSRALALIAVYLAVFRDYTPHLAPGEVATIGIIASNRSQARSIFRFVSGLLDVVPALKGMVADQTGEQITLTNNVQIEISTASFRSTRGYSYAAVLADEIAFWRSDETSANPDIEILRAIRPGMANIPGSILLLASSPYAKRGSLYQAFRRHYGKDDARVLVWKADTATMNPKIDPAIIAEAYESDPEAARAEYGGEFRDDLADFVTIEVVQAVTAWGRTELPPEPGVAYTAFCDPSGGSNDAMTLAIAHRAADGLIVLDAIREARPPFSPEAVVIDFAATLADYGISTVTGDRYAGEWPRQRFREHGITYEASARPKSDIYIDLLPMLNAKRIEILENHRLSAQLVGLERRTARSGKDSVDHVPGGHDDLANAVAGVLVGLDLDRRPSMVDSKDLAPQEGGRPDIGICDYIFGVLSVAKDGRVGIVYVAVRKHLSPPLRIVDFDGTALTGALMNNIRVRLLDLAIEFGARRVMPVLILPAELIGYAQAAGLVAQAPPDIYRDEPSLMLKAASHVSQGSVKLTTAVREKSETSDFAGSFTFRGGDAVSSPLQHAALLAIAVGLEGRHQH